MQNTAVPAPKTSKTGEWIWSWIEVGPVILFLLGGVVSFMTSGHPLFADLFLLAGFVLFSIKFFSWETVKHFTSWLKVLIVGIVLLVSIGIAYINHYIINSHVAITPSNITFDNSSDLDVEKPIEFKNTKSDAIYDIWIKIEASGNFNFDDIDITPEAIDESLSKNIVDAQSGYWRGRINYEIIRFYAIDLNTNKPCIYLYLLRLKGDESRTMKFLKKALNAGDRSNTSLSFRLKILSFGSETTTSFDRTHLAIDIYPPENMKVIRMMYIATDKAEVKFFLHDKNSR